MRQSLLNKFYHPTLFFFLLPIFQIILGMIFSLRYNALHFLSFGILYLFTLFNQMLENILLRIPDSEFNFSKGFFFTVELLNLLTILYFGLQYSWLTSLFLLLFTINIQAQFLFSYYDLEFYATILAVVLKIVFLNSFSFFIGTGFIQLRFVLYFIGLILPFFLYEVSRIRPEMNKSRRFIIIGLSYVIGVSLLWQLVGFLSLLLLISVPFAWGFIHGDFNRKNASVFTINFSLLYVLLVLYSIIP